MTAGSTHAAAIDCIVWYALSARLGDGCYGPANGVRRDQMAAFLARGHAQVTGTPLPAGASVFHDVVGNTHRASIQSLAAVGVVNGVAPGVYDPSGTVRRDQMASFLARTLESLTGADHPPALPQ